MKNPNFCTVVWQANKARAVGIWSLEYYIFALETREKRKFLIFDKNILPGLKNDFEIIFDIYFELKHKEIAKIVI